MTGPTDAEKKRAAADNLAARQRELANEPQRLERSRATTERAIESAGQALQAALSELPAAATLRQAALDLDAILDRDVAREIVDTIKATPPNAGEVRVPRMTEAVRERLISEGYTVDRAIRTLADFGSETPWRISWRTE